MKIKIGNGYQTFSCSIAPASGIIVTFPEDEDLDSDTVAYAICRLFCRSPKLAQPYVWESYQLRLATGKERKVQRHRITIPASLAELPGGWINVKFSVAPTGIQVDRVEYLGLAGGPIYGDAPAAGDAEDGGVWTEDAGPEDTGFPEEGPEDTEAPAEGTEAPEPEAEPEETAPETAAEETLPEEPEAAEAPEQEPEEGETPPEEPETAEVPEEGTETPEPEAD